MNSDQMRTRPMIEALIERLDAFAKRTDANFERLSGGLQTLKIDVEGLKSEVQGLTQRVERLEGEARSVQTELTELSDRVLLGFRKLDARMEVLSATWLEVRTDMRDLNRRVDRIQPEQT